jgi:ABC-type Fe3+-hydroxamate transport system substrate-binding protein
LILKINFITDSDTPDSLSRPNPECAPHPPPEIPRVDHPSPWRPIAHCRALLALALFALAAPAPAVARDQTAHVTRVATLVPFVADALGRMPDKALVVASVRPSSVAPPPAGVVDLGSPHAPNLELLASSSPDIVVGDEAMHAAMTEALGRSGARVILIDTGSVDGTFAGLLEVGQQVGVSDEMKRAVAESRAGIEAEALRAPIVTLPLFGAPGSFLVITQRTWLGDLLVKLNFANVAGGATGKETYPGYVTLSDELVAGYKPQLVLVVAHGDPQAIRAAFLRRAEEDGPWQSLRDARLGVHVLDPAQFAANPGLGLRDAARSLHRLAEPTAATP